MRRYDDARAAISFIATVNKKPQFTSKFDREVTEEKQIAEKKAAESGLNQSQLGVGPTSPK